MKKLILIILMLTVLLTSVSTALAKNYDFKHMKTFAAEINEKKSVIIANQKTIKNLQQHLKKQIKQVKNQTQLLRNNNRSLDARKIDIVKQTMISIENSNHVLGSTLGSINKKTAALKNAGKRNEPGLFLNSMDEIIAVQEQRLTELQKITVDLDKMIRELK